MKNIILLNDIFFGDSVKGKWTDYLVRKLNKNLVVRFNGGSNSAHNVVVGKIHHTFSQFGSGTLAGSATLFSKHTLIEPLALENEATVLSEKVPFNPYSKHFIDSRAKLITPFHVLANRLTSESKTTTGMGIWVTELNALDRPNDYLTISDLRSADLKNKLLRTKEYIQNKYGSNSAYDMDIHDLLKKYNSISANLNILEPAEVNEMLNRSNLLFEGSQGILLDENYGFHPYQSGSTTTKKNALEVLAEAGITEKPINIGLARVYANQHGKNPFPTYNTHLTSILPEPHNGFNRYQGEFKCGFADLELLKYAIRVNDGIDYIAFSHLDYLKKLDSWNVSIAYENCEMFVPKSLTEQELLGQRLFNAIPQYEKIKSADVPSFLSKELNQEIFGVSYGAESNKTIVSNVYG